MSSRLHTGSQLSAHRRNPVNAQNRFMGEMLAVMEKQAASGYSVCACVCACSLHFIVPQILPNNPCPIFFLKIQN